MSTSDRGLIDRIMLPCSNLMSKLRLRTKLLCMVGSFILAMFLLGSHIVQKEIAEAEVANSELQGVLLSRQIMEILLQTQKHRGLVNLKLSGQDTEAALGKTRTALNSGLDLLDAQVATHPELELAPAWKPVADELRQLAGGKIAESAAASILQHGKLITQILRFSALNNEKSGLLFDPEAATYLLMDVAIQKMPLWVEQLGVLRGLGAGYIKTGNIDFSAKATLSSRLDALQSAMQAVSFMDEALLRAGESVSTEQQAVLVTSQKFADTVRKNLLGENVTGEADSYFQEGTQAIEQAIALQLRLQDRLTTLLSERAHALDLRRNLIIAILLGTLLLTIYLVSGFYRGFMKAMSEVGLSVSSVTSGDLTRTIAIVGTDELAQTGRTLEQMNFNLSALVANVRTDASKVSQLGEQLAGGIRDMAIRTEQQASSLEETSASVEELADTVKKNAGSARAVNDLAANVRLIAEDSGATMRSAVDSMHGIQDSAVKVQEIVSIIDAISFQTNILALNAAVEAARAGEQGRGFAVVASEVRSLAQRSADSARQIKHLIDDSVARVGTGVGQINQVSKTLSDIVGGIRDLASNINSISTASTEQSNGLAQISEAIRHLDKITQSNGQMAEQAKDTSILLEQRAQALTKLVSAFKLRQGTADEAYVLVRKALSLYDSKGRASFQMITADREKTFADRDMYVFAFDRNGQYLAFAGNPAKVGVSLMNISGLDGRKLVQEAFSLPHSGGWVDYTIINPVSKKVETKTSYMQAVTDEIVLGCGVYKIV